MLDLRRIGAYISRLRKDQDWTQLELADQLNVSHQAVSKWERGDSLPDIGTLPQVAGLFGLTVDDILNAGNHADHREHPHMGRIVEEIAGNRPGQVAEMVNAGKLEMEELVEVAPFVKASALHKVTEGIDSSALTLDVIMRLAPFLGRDTLDELIRQVEEDTLGWQSINWHSIQGLAPFISRETLDRLVDQVADGPVDANRIMSLAPFLNRDRIGKLLGEVEADQLNPDLLASLAPFMDQGTLSRMVTGLLNRRR